MPFDVIQSVSGNVDVIGKTFMTQRLFSETKEIGAIYKGKQCLAVFMSKCYITYNIAVIVICIALHSNTLTQDTPCREMRHQ